MTAETNRIAEQLSDLEAQLSLSVSSQRRVHSIDQLLAYYVYTDPRRARDLLREQRQLLDEQFLPEAELSYFQHLAAVENQDYRYGEAERALQKALELIEEYGTIQQRIDTCIDYVGTLINLRRMEEALHYHSVAERLLATFPDDELSARSFSRHGVIYLHSNRYSRAIQKFLQSFNFLGTNARNLSLKSHYFYTLVNTGLGNVYERTGEIEKAIEAYERATDRCEQLGMRGRLVWHYLNLGNAYLATGDVELAGRYFAMVINNESDANPEARAAACANLGSCYIELQRYEEAEELLDQAEALYAVKAKPDYANSATMAIYRARIQAEQGQLEAAITQLEEGRKLAQAAGDPIILADISLNLARHYAEQADFAAAYTAQLEYDRYQQQHQAQLNHQRQQELEAQYKTEAKEKEAERLKLKASQLQLKALRAQMNPHFLYNCLNSIQSFISTNEASTASRYLAKFAMLMRQSLEYTNLEYISLEDEISFLTDYLDISCHLRFEGKLEYVITVDDELEEDIQGVPTMIIQPYVENAIEHGLRGQDGGRIEISFAPHGDASILATVTDNGIGRRRIAEIQANDATRLRHRSRGTEITLSRLQLLDPELMHREAVKIIDRYDKADNALGTRVEVVIPVVDLQLIKPS